MNYTVKELLESVNFEREYVKQHHRTSGRNVKIDKSEGKYVVSDIKNPDSHQYNTGIKHTHSEMIAMLDVLKSRPDYK